MALWKNINDNSIHDDMDGFALSLSSWPKNVVHISAEEANIILQNSSLNDDEISIQVRSQRDEMLSSSDWTQLPDAPLSSIQKSDWTKYRQELRDITNQKGFPKNIAWPIKPDS